MTGKSWAAVSNERLKMTLANETQNRAHTVAPESDPIVVALLTALAPHCAHGEQWNLTVVGNHGDEYHLTRMDVEGVQP